MKIVFLIGNGFNYLIESLIRNIPPHNIPLYLDSTQDELATRIKEISSLWKKFDVLLKDLQTNYPKVGDEELIRMIYAVLDFFSSIDAFNKILTPGVIAGIKNTFNFLLIDKIREIAEEFRIHENSQGYKDLKRLFPDFGEDCKLIMTRNEVLSCDFYTTNYDGILDTLLTKSGSKGFLAVDGFGKDPNFSKYYRLYEDNMESDFRCFHIHGSYRFEKLFGNTYKNSKNSENLDPVIIFNNPQLKERLINRDPVLSRYFLAFQQSLKDADKFVILGNSMKCEPHIKELIRRNFSGKNKSIYVCSRSPTEVKSEVSKVHYNEVFERTTKDINTVKDLLLFIEEIVKHKP